MKHVQVDGGELWLQKQIIPACVERSIEQSFGEYLINSMVSI